MKAPALNSIGIGGSLVVLSSVFFALTFLPAVLGMLGPRINALSLRGLLARFGIVSATRQPGHRWERQQCALVRLRLVGHHSEQACAVVEQRGAQRHRP